MGVISIAGAGSINGADSGDYTLGRAARLQHRRRIIARRQARLERRAGRLEHRRGPFAAQRRRIIARRQALLSRRGARIDNALQVSRVAQPISGYDVMLGKRAARGRGAPGLAAFLRNFRRMNRNQRKAAWRRIPRARKALFLLAAGPVILPLLAAAGVAATATAVAAPFAVAAIGRRLRQRKQKQRAARARAATARRQAAVATASGNTAAAAQATATAVAAESEVVSEQTAIENDQQQLSASGVTPEQAEAAAESTPATPAGNPIAALVPVGAIAALALL